LLIDHNIYIATNYVRKAGMNSVRIDGSSDDWQTCVGSAQMTDRPVCVGSAQMTDRPVWVLTTLHMW